MVQCHNLQPVNYGTTSLKEASGNHINTETFASTPHYITLDVVKKLEPNGSALQYKIAAAFLLSHFMPPLLLLVFSRYHCTGKVRTPSNVAPHQNILFPYTQKEMRPQNPISYHEKRKKNLLTVFELSYLEASVHASSISSLNTSNHLASFVELE